MHKKTLNIMSVCVVALVIVFSITQKNKLSGKTDSDNISIDESGNIQTKADEYKSNIIDTVSQENVKNFQKFSKTFEKNSSDNLTDGFSKDIFTQYIKYNTSGEIKDEDVVNAAQDILNTKTDLANPTVYGDIRISAGTVTNLKTYGNDTATIQNGINIGIGSLNSKANSKKNKLSALANIYDTAAKLFTQTPVPESMASTHLEIRNGYRTYAEGLRKIDLQNTDPAKALLGVSQAKDATQKIVDSFDKIQKAIIRNKITYTENEMGYMWLGNSIEDIAIKLQ